jgi:hypothetical protein
MEKAETPPIRRHSSLPKKMDIPRTNAQIRSDSYDPRFAKHTWINILPYFRIW